MKGVVLAGGFATRLRPLSCSKPKLLFPLVGVPLMDRLIEWLSEGRVGEVILAVNHLSDKLRIEVASRKLEDKVVLSIEENPLGTGGPIRLVSSMFNPGEPVVVANGDVVSDIDVQSLVADHIKSEADATLALVSVSDSRQFGSATVDARERIVRFVEKSERPSSGWVNAGVYVLNPSVVEMIPKGRAVSLEREIFPLLVERGRLRGYRHKGFWYDIGKIADYVRANRELLERPESLKTRKSMKLDLGVEVEEPLYVGDDCNIAPGSRLGPYTIVSQKVGVGTRSVIRNTIVFEESSIGNDCLIEDCLIGEAVKIGSGVRIGKGSVIAGEVVIPNNTTVNPRSTVLN